MSTLAEFLTARLDEDEAVARANDLWLAGPEPWRFYEVDAHYGGIGIDPRRVLAEVAARRAIVAEHSSSFTHPFGWKDGALIDLPACDMCGTPGLDAVTWPCSTLRLLVQPYAEHPDFDPEWKLP